MSDPLHSYDQVRLHGFGDMLREQARSRPQHIALVEQDTRYTYSQLHERINRLTHALRQRGVSSGSRLLWLGQNSYRVLELLGAAARLGAIVCPANWRMTAAETIRTLVDFEPSIIFWQESEVGDIAREARAAGAEAGRPVWIQHDGSDEHSYEALLAAGADEDDESRVDPDLPLLAIYTAAFDGAPMAALLSHTTLMLQGLMNTQSQLIAETSSYLVSGPMFHVGVMMGTLATILAGGRCVFVSRPDAQTLLQVIAAERVTHAFLVHPTIEQMRQLNVDGRYDVSSLFNQPDMSDWRMPMVMPASAPLVAKLGGYGQTEIGGLSVLLWLGGSGAGRPAPFIQVKILDEEGNETPSGTPGEIAVRGALVMNGYLGQTQENGRRTRDGWHRTNDLGLRKPDGSIVFVGPKTTMIKSGLENIYPAEVESCLRSHPAVADVCVIGVPDPTWTQNVKAVIVTRPGAEVSAEALINHCRERIASYKKPKMVAFVDALPRNSAGGIDRAGVDAAHGGGNYPRVA
jgi:long-chain acyl-CoA synthetase